MAKIVYGFGSSHGPLLSTPPERWDLRAADDRKNPAHPYKNHVYSFPELVEARASERNFADEASIEARTGRHERNQAAMDHLSEKVAEIDPDVVVIVGDDQHEWFLQQVQPAFTVYCGNQVVNTALDVEKMKTKSPGIALAMKAQYPPVDKTYPVPRDLGKAIIKRAVEDEFDVTASMEQPTNAKGLIGIGHAFGFICRRILRDRPVPILPILLNTYFPPNQPTAKRCYAFGQSIGRAIAAWGGEHADKRVAICASGGISHFVVDEDFDTRVLEAFKSKNVQPILDEPETMFRAGTSETKNWITVAGILSETDLNMNVVDYVPAYRSEGGTGCGMGFASWE
ncbi:MAG: protocatechuate 3,4-dioxygenase [Rhodospirillales bacterium]|jgi:3-O-methylgallate 3,4-dioxygenase|nr:protocatechuate 3,4-dioxygenase [Rhodospirillales bacterium]MBT4005945.1 protocatechuate 3,4-dioxygenase [Rhodospirillales bacterium]MBT5076139.1 protocatechuate 3,4-dioxygenase [Rhodospirillales bacterium]MBT5114186.1 protocatechuate 3,4-dioxygenase [Rhodospirillales bacterium]MBT5673225.1 protocatechuate 3,4-dioxygenase [Rhodospirillales bacterium]